MRRASVLAIVCAVSLAGVACGSGDADKKPANPPAAAGTAPATRQPAKAAASAHATSVPRTIAAVIRTTPSAPASTPVSEMAAFTKTSLPASTPISSAPYHDALVKAVEQAGGKPKVGEAIANCMQQILRRAGIRTVGEAQKIKQDPTGNKAVANGAFQCLGASQP